MTPGTHAGSDPAGAERAGEGGRWRIRWDRGWRYVGTPLVLVLATVIFVTSALQSEGTDLRPGRYDGLAGLVSADSRSVQAKNARVKALSDEVEDLTNAVADRGVQRLERRRDRLRRPAGLTPVSGKAVTVTLSDAPYDTENPPEIDDINVLVVHQQDIQAVVNAMWTGGAKAVTVQGQRVVATTGIKCEGNSVQLHGVPYPQPYVIVGVGSQEDILAAIEKDSYLAGYRALSASPLVNIGWELETLSRYTAPAYDGLLDLTYATVER